MIFTHYFYQASKLPKYLAEVAAFVEKADKSVFASQEEFEKFFHMAEKKLEECKPDKCEAVAQLYKSRQGDGGIYIYIRRDYDRNAVIRLCYQTLERVLDYDPKAGDFFDISEELENLFTKGGDHAGD